jgi:enoyl-[acyl-carrier protein] reductase II
MMAAMVLGAEGVQVGTRFVASLEASSHAAFKDRVIHSEEGDTQLSMKKLVPVRMIKNAFFKQVWDAEQRGAGEDELKQILGRARAKKGMFEGDLDEGELEIGQVCALVKEILPAKEIVRILWEEFLEATKHPFKIV